MRTITTAMRWKALGSQCTTALHPFIPRRALSTEGRSAVASASASTSAPAPASKDTQQATTANGSHSSPKDHSPRTTSTSQKQRLKRLGNYTDVLSVRVQGGNGGSGCVHFAREPFRAVAPPDGGDGGRGGNVWLEVVEGGRDLGHLTRRYLAEHGGMIMWVISVRWLLPRMSNA